MSYVRRDVNDETKRGRGYGKLANEWCWLLEATRCSEARENGEGKLDFNSAEPLKSRND
jgi:hypothetical protein